MTNAQETMYFEKLVLSKLINFKEVRKHFKLEPQYFLDKKHANLADLFLKNIDITYEEVLTNAVSNPETYGDYDFVSDISSIDIVEIVNISGFNNDQERILEFYKLREIDKKINEYNKEKNLESAQLIQSEINKLSQLSVNKDSKKTEVLMDMFDSLFNDNADPILETGFEELDLLIGGIEVNQFNIIAARPSMGKTAFALQLAKNLQATDTEIIFCSAESSESNMTRRILSNISGVPLYKFKRPNDLMTVDDIDKVTASIGLYSEMNIDIMDDAIFTPNKIRAIVQGMDDSKNKVVFIDYLQLMKSDSRKSQRFDEVSEISRELKILSNEVPNLTIVALSQLSRAVESRNDKRPNMSDLRESGQIEQDANMIMFLYRDDYYNREEESSDDKSLLEVIVGKNKDGRQGTAKVHFYKETQRLY